MALPSEPTSLPASLHFHLTRRGWLFGILSALIGSVGIYRKELASILWGIGMGSVWVFALLCSAYTAFLLFRRRIHILQHLSMVRPRKDLYAGTPLTFSVSLPSEVLRGLQRVPGILIWYQYRVSAFPGRIYAWKAMMDPRTPSFESTPSPPLRGDYRGIVGFLQVEDCFRFFQFEIPLPSEEHLLVFPVTSASFPLSNLSALGGSRPREHQPKQTALEELEIRKYIPGDDPRRLHWKLLAHSGELFLRMGEQDPPPMETFHLHFDPTLPQSLDPNLFLEAVDQMASIGASVLLDLSRRGSRILLSTNPPTTPISTYVSSATTPSGNTPAPDTHPQTRWFQAPVIEMEGGHPEEGLAELARLSPYPILEQKALAVPTPTPPSRTSRILFLFADSPVSQRFQQLQTQDERVPLSPPVEVLSSRFGGSPLWVILIHPPKGPDHG